MNLEKIEHIGIAVKNLREAEEKFTELFQATPYKREVVESEGVETSFYRIGESKIELLAAINEQSPITKFIEKRGEGIHHMAFDVKNIYQEMERMQERGFQLISPEPKRGADNKLVCFLHPRSANGVLVELCQEIKD